MTLLGSGAILTEVVKSAQLLAAQGVAVNVFSITSWIELARDGQTCGAQGGLAGASPDAGAGASSNASHLTPYVAQQLLNSAGPMIAVTNYARDVPESIRACLPAGHSYVTMGTDGFGRSDTLAALRGSSGWMPPALNGRLWRN